MSFHPKMAYDATFHKSSRTLTEPGEPFTYTAENRARFDVFVARYPPDRRRSAVYSNGAPGSVSTRDDRWNVAS